MVSLVGGGPGDIGLITVKGLKRIQEADCIIYDRLSSPELLQEARKDCELIYVGKANHHHTMKQEDMNLLLVEKAKQYQNVVRLKGGDPYVFGRGGEEALVLKEQGIPFEVVPGISSSIAGLAYAGIPITHRGVAMGFHVVTAHNKKDELAEIDFSSMARGQDTCVFLMGLSKVKEIADHLIEAGMSPETPSAVISKATTVEQRTCVAPLAQIAEEVEKAALPSPALIVVGDVVKLREQLNFFEQKKLFGKHYLVTKIGEKQSRLTTLLAEKGAIVKEVQTGAIQNKEILLEKETLAQANWLIFTSANGVTAFFENLFQAGLDTRSLWHCKIASIGKKTSKVLQGYGVCPDLQPEQANADALVCALKEELDGTEEVWYIKAMETDSTLRDGLQNQCRYKEVILYENVEKLNSETVQESLQEKFDGIFFTCASSVKRFFAGKREHMAVDDADKILSDIVCYSIGEKTTEALKECGVLRIVQVNEATYEALVEAIE